MKAKRSLGFGKAVAPKKSLQQQIRKIFRQSRLRERKYGSRVLQEISKLEKDQQAEGNREASSKKPNGIGAHFQPSEGSDLTLTRTDIDSSNWGSGNDSSQLLSGDSARNQEHYTRLHKKHGQEIVVGSYVDEEVASLNFQSLSGDAPYDYLFYSDKIERRNDGRVTEGTLKRYRHIENGGWWVGGIDLLAFEDGLWGQFKPDSPREDGNGKIVKYEAPLKVPTEAIALRIPARIWELIARRYDVALPDNYQSLPFGAFWKWVIENPQIPVIVVEGAKKAGAILSCGYVAIALPGINSGYRQPKDEFGEPTGFASLIPQLQVFAQPGRRIYFCFDQDQKRKTVRAVNGAIAKTAKLFAACKCEVSIITWNALMGKGIDDVIVAHGQEQFDKFYREALSFTQWQTQQLKRLSYPVDLLLNQRYLGEFIPPANKQLICLKAPKGTGKTEWLAWFTDPVIKSGERKVLLITHRVQLSTQTANRLGLPYITEKSELGALFGMGMCIDSLHPKSQAKFNPEEWRGCWLIIDEVQQVIWHLLNSKTCQSERVSIIKTLKQLLLNIINYGGKIFIADADLNDIAIDFIRGLLGDNIEPWIIENEYKFQQPWNIYCFGGTTPASLIKMLEEKLKAGEKHLLCVSGQKAKSKWGSRNLEVFLAKKIPSLRILRIDSETVADPKHPAYRCTENINEVVKNYDLVITTATVETGISIEEKHFDGVWGVFQGVQTTDSVRQHLSRYRLPVPRYLWVKPVGINRIGNGATTVKGLLAGEYKKDKSNINRLTSIGFEESIDGNFEPVCLTTWAKMGALINLGMASYKQQILEDLESEGHYILDASELEELPNESESEALKKDITKTCETEYLQYRSAVSNADSLDDEKYNKLSKQQCKTQDEQLQYRKGELERRYNVPINADLVEKDDNGWYSEVRLHYYFDKGRQHLADREKHIFLTALVNGDGDYFKPDTNSKLIGKRIDALDWLKFEELLKVEEITNSHPLAVETFKKCKDPKNLYSLKLLLGIDFSQAKSPIQVLQSLMGLIGYRFPFLRREGGRGNQIRVWGKAAAEFERCPLSGRIIVRDGKAIPINDSRDAVFKAWLERDALAAEKAEAERQKQQQQSQQSQQSQQQSEQSEQSEQSQRSHSTTTASESDEWETPENLKYVTEQLNNCETPEMLAELRLSAIPPRIFSLAARDLPSEKQSQIRAWVLAA